MMTNLRYLYLYQRVARAALDESAHSAASDQLQRANEELVEYDGERFNQRFCDYYDDASAQSFLWLTAPNSSLQALTQDVLDTIRTLRCADALRQRGQVLKTSAQYEILVDNRSANAVYALQLGADRLFMLEIDDLIGAGEANVASSELDAQGNLRITFQRGRFTDPGAIDHAVECAVVVIDDIQRDVLESFWLPTTPAMGDDLKPAHEMVILIEETDDDLSFSGQVRDRLVGRRPELTGRVLVAPSLQASSDLERERYLVSVLPDWSRETRANVLARLGQTGHPVDQIDPERAFEHVKLTRLDQGELLFDVGSAPAFAYIPLDLGLVSHPTGGYQSLPVEPWLTLAATSVISGSARSAAVIADRTAHVLMIPASVYRRHWHGTLAPDRFREAVTAALREMEQPDQGMMSVLEKSLLLANVPLFVGVDEQGLRDLATKAVEVTLASGQVLFEKGDPGASLYVIASGELEVCDDQRILAQLGARESFGEIAAISPELRMASVRAVSDSRLLRLDQRPLQELLDGNGSVARAVTRALIGYIRFDRNVGE